MLKYHCVPLPETPEVRTDSDSGSLGPEKRLHKMEKEEEAFLSLNENWFSVGNLCSRGHEAEKATVDIFEQLKGN